MNHIPCADFVGGTTVVTTAPYPGRTNAKVLVAPCLACGPSETFLSHDVTFWQDLQ